MNLKGNYILQYSVDKKEELLAVEIELKPINGLLKPKQNIYYSIVYINGSYDLEKSKELLGCINAKFAAEDIGEQLKTELKHRLRIEKKSFRLIKEELK